MVLPETEEYLPYFTTVIEYDSYGRIPGIWDAVVQNITKAKVELKYHEFKFGAEFSSAYIVIGGIRKDGISGEFDLPDSGVISGKAVLTDSRGFSKEEKFIVEVEAYSNPTVTCSSIYRCDEAGVPDRAGKCAAISFEKFFSSVRGLNITTVKVKYKKSNETAYSDFITLTSSPYILQNDFDESSSYDFIISVTDVITKTPFEIQRTLSSADIPFNIKKGGKGAAFGCYAENDNELTVGYNLNVKGNLNYTDLSDLVNYNKYVVKKEMSVKRFDCLGIIYFKAKLLVLEKIPANAWVTVAGVQELNLQQLCPIPTTIDFYTPDRVMAGIINVNGQVKVISSNGFEVGEVIYMNSVFS